MTRKNLKVSDKMHEDLLLKKLEMKFKTVDQVIRYYFDHEVTIDQFMELDRSLKKQVTLNRKLQQEIRLLCKVLKENNINEIPLIEEPSKILMFAMQEFGTTFSNNNVLFNSDQSESIE